MDEKKNVFRKLIFIYNADSGLGNVLLDGVHKIVSSNTYNCSLCSLTFGPFSEKTKWKKFKEKSQIEMEFLHKDEFKKSYASKFGLKFSYPIVLIEIADQFEVFIDSKELNAFETEADLIDCINNQV